jgi:hypothetical protein
VRYREQEVHFAPLSTLILAPSLQLSLEQLQLIDGGRGVERKDEV